MDSKKIELKNTRKYGKGVYAAKPIKKGELIAVFDGPVYDETYEAWTRDLLEHTIQIARGVWKDSAGIARYINHSCEPNCGIKGLDRVVAMRNIEPGEEITWDYEMTEDSDWLKLKCKCGTSSCRKVIGAFRRMPEAVRKKYRGYISDWLVKEFQLK